MSTQASPRRADPSLGAAWAVPGARELLRASRYARRSPHKLPRTVGTAMLRISSATQVPAKEPAPAVNSTRKGNRASHTA